MNLLLPTPTPANAPKLDIYEIDPRKLAIPMGVAAVISRLLGYNVAWVSIDKEFIGKDTAAIALGLEMSPAVCMTLSDGRIDEILTKHKALTKREKQTVIDRCTEYLAESGADLMFNGYENHDRHHSVQAFPKIERLLGSVEPNAISRHRMTVAAFRQLEKMAAERLNAICNVADALRDLGTLSGDQIDEEIRLGLAKAA